jgi:hypothetical protein
MIKYLILFNLLFCSSLFAESDSTKAVQRNIKLNLGMLIFSEFDFTYECFLKPDKSIETGIGIVFPAKHLQGTSTLFDKPENFYSYGVIISSQYKKYFGKRIYISPLFKYKFLFYNNQWISRHTGEGAYIYYETLEDCRRQTFSLQLLFGIQSKRKFKIDFYTGFGGRCIFTIYNEKDFRKTPTIRYPGIYNDIYFTSTFHMGLKMGLSF